jgi:hypothetical protein
MPIRGFLVLRRHARPRGRYMAFPGGKRLDSVPCGYKGRWPFHLCCCARRSRICQVFHCAKHSTQCGAADENRQMDCRLSHGVFGVQLAFQVYQPVTAL